MSAFRSRGKNRAIYLPKRSASSTARCVDITEQNVYVSHEESDGVTPQSCYSLLELVDSLEIDLEGKSEVIVKRALEKKFSTYNVDIDVDKSVRGMSALPVLATAALKRADVNVYTGDRAKLLLQVEVHSSPIRETVCKAIYGAADLLRLLRYTNESFQRVTVLVFPKMCEETCVGKITLGFEDSLHFDYRIKWLTNVGTVWEEIQTVLEENICVMPELPHIDAVHSKYLTILSPQELKCFGVDARQVISPFHVLVESKGKIFKVVTDKDEQILLDGLLLEKLANAINPPRHFIIPAKTKTHLFCYDKVPFGPLREDQAHKCLKTLSEKIAAALEELHGFGFAHGDVRLPNVCFNINYDAVLIDMERSGRIGDRAYSTKLFGLCDTSCMYRRSEKFVGRFTEDLLDNVQLGWLLVWVLNPTEDYHEREWKEQPLYITKDVFLSKLVCEGVYSREALTYSLVQDEENTIFSSLFEA